MFYHFSFPAALSISITSKVEIKNLKQSTSENQQGSCYFIFWQLVVHRSPNVVCVLSTCEFYDLKNVKDFIDYGLKLAVSLLLFVKHIVIMIILWSANKYFVNDKFISRLPKFILYNVRKSVSINFYF